MDGEETTDRSSATNVTGRLAFSEGFQLIQEEVLASEHNEFVVELLKKVYSGITLEGPDFHIFKT